MSIYYGYSAQTQIINVVDFFFFYKYNIYFLSNLLIRYQCYHYIRRFVFRHLSYLYLKKNKDYISATTAAEM